MTMARILVVEDEADIREVLDYNLKREGHDVALASTARDGLRQARERRPDLVLLDLMLPDGSGTDLCKALHQDAATRGVRVVMLTAKGEEIDRVIGLKSAPTTTSSSLSASASCSCACRQSSAGQRPKRRVR